MLCLLCHQHTLCLGEEVTDDEVDDEDNNAADNNDGDEYIVENSAISRGATDRRVGECRLTKRSKPLFHRRGRE